MDTDRVVRVRKAKRGSPPASQLHLSGLICPPLGASWVCKKTLGLMLTSRPSTVYLRGPAVRDRETELTGDPWTLLITINTSGQEPDVPHIHTPSVFFVTGTIQETSTNAKFAWGRDIKLLFRRDSPNLHHQMIHWWDQQSDWRILCLPGPWTCCSNIVFSRAQNEFALHLSDSAVHLKTLGAQSGLWLQAPTTVAQYSYNAENSIMWSSR